MIGQFATELGERHIHQAFDPSARIHSDNSSQYRPSPLPGESAVRTSCGRSHTPVPPVLSGRDQASPTPTMTIPHPLGCRCPHRYSAIMAIQWLSAWQVGSVGAHGSSDEEVLRVHHLIESEHYRGTKYQSRTDTRQIPLAGCRLRQLAKEDRPLAQLTLADT